MSPVEYVMQPRVDSVRGGPVHAARLDGTGKYVAGSECGVQPQRSHRTRRGTAVEVTCRKCLRAIAKAAP